MKKLFSLIIASLFLFPAPVQAQGSNSSSNQITCIPVQQLSQDKTQLECRMRSEETPYFLVSEVAFPFKVTRLIRVSSTYSASLGLQYPTAVVDNTIFVSSVSWGDSLIDPQMQAIPFDSLSIMIETNQSMGDVKDALASGSVDVSLLSPNPADPLAPIFQTLTVEDNILFDGTLILESFTQYVSPGVLQFIRLGVSCYEQTAQACLSNVIQKL
jgi:hypothetical protein